MPKRTKHHPAHAVTVQLPLFAEAASLARIRPERNERRRGTQASKAGMSWACRSLWLQT